MTEDFQITRERLRSDAENPYFCQVNLNDYENSDNRIWQNGQGD